MAERIETPGISESSNTVNYNIYVFIENPWNRRLARSQLNESIWWGLKEAGIEIAFPQLDVHFDQR
jgi:small-conductance mechanosensitive channel